eukprot:gnl/TRDRNA2_/TRDRNA2_165138_c0_seq1.p3 gnl/TRDRNA2_/TRDRNA2_165138_c0~~gnl/TRDRNA2_/TRDRNA2_165138_c0_seq1.p3  ORF type:complete len:105 (+),score=20.75 gnl/TRDRNA2_/TRDRNA2_165138_c0_seq1:195-509(+)
MRRPALRRMDTLQEIDETEVDESDDEGLSRRRCTNPKGSFPTNIVQAIATMEVTAEVPKCAMTVNAAAVVAVIAIVAVGSAEHGCVRRTMFKASPAEGVVGNHS